jgi:hypothetical protein
MMKRKLLPASLLSFAMLFLFLSSCKKDDINLNNGNNEYTLKQLFTYLKSTPQTFMVTAGTAQTITGAKGTLLIFNPQSFKDASGNIISSGMISIELTEMYTPGAMIANRVNTSTANNYRLTSGGCVNIKATMGGAEVFANDYDIAFKQPAPKEQPMALFRGYSVIDSTGTTIQWSDDSTNTVDRTTKLDTTQNFYYLFDSCTTFNWINCDYFYSAPSPKTDITVVLPDNTYDLSNTQVYVIFPGINSVTCMYSFDATAHAFKFGYSNYFIPVGSQVHVIVIGAKGGSYYMAQQQNITVTNNHTLNLTPVTQPVSAIQALLNTL